MVHFFSQLDFRFLSILFLVLLLAFFLPEKNLKLFRSVRFNIFLFAVIAILAAGGTLLPHAKSKIPIFPDLSNFNLYHTWWFLALLGLLAFDVIVCKLRREPFNIFDVPNAVPNNLDLQETILQRRAVFLKSFESTQNYKELSDQIEQWGQNKDLNFKKLASEDHITFYGGRQTLQRWGDFILHISIVVILLAGLIGGLFGFEESLLLTEGSSVRMKNRPFDVSFSKFQIQFYPITQKPSLYESDLEVKKGPLLLAQKKIRVNHPLDINGVRFYQSSWGMTEDFRSVSLFLGGHKVILAPMQKVLIPKTPLALRPVQFFPSFDIDQNRHAINRNNNGENPAIKIEFLSGDQVQMKFWIIKNDPRLVFVENGDILSQADEPPFKIVDVDPVYFSGIQVAFDPGVPLFWTGAIFLIVGLGLHFYTHQRRIKIIVSLNKSGSRILVGGWNSRDPHDFESEFELWTHELQKLI